METIITPRKAISLDLRELWAFRELLYIFTWRDLKVRYKQTILGVGWVLFQPMVTTAIFSIFFGKLAKLPSEAMPYPLFVLVGLTIWTFFSSALSTGGISLVSYESMLKKVYFPRIIIPLSATLTAFVDFGITLLFLAGFIVYYRFTPSVESLWLFPLLLVILLMVLIGLSVFTAALNVKYRDIRFILPFFIQIGLFISPVIYPIGIIYDYRKWFLYLNPLSAVIESTRSLISGSAMNWPLIITGLATSSLILILGLVYFSQTESYFADIA